MNYSEFLRNKRAAAPKIVSPTRIRDSGLWTQIKRYKSSVPERISHDAGQVTLLSADGVIAAHAGKAVCCGPVQRTVYQPGQCCDKIVPRHPAPTNAYLPKKPDCCPVNGPAVTACVVCNNLPANSALITYTSKPKTQG